MDWYFLVSFSLKLLALGIILFYVIPKQFVEVLRPKSWLTNLRWYILILFMTSILTAVPSLSYQVLLVQGQESEILRRVASITGNISDLATSVLLVLIYNYRKKDN